MLNAEHYKDPTASRAVDEVSKSQPMTYFNKPAYIRPKYEQRFPYKTIDVEEMGIDDLRPYVYNCAKSKMSMATCSNCNPGCIFGRRVIEIMKQETNPEPVRNNHGPMANKIRAMQEYQAAIASGDVFQYALDHAKSPDPKKAKAAAWARVSGWRKKYGDLIKEPPKSNKDSASDEQPHLMQMPCLSKKIAAERKAATESDDMKLVFMEMYNTFKASLNDIQSRIEDLESQRNLIQKKVSALQKAAGLLNIEL